MNQSTPAFSIIGTLCQAWKTLQGSKAPIWGVLIVALVSTVGIIALIDIILHYGLGILPKEVPYWAEHLVIPLAAALIPSPLFAGSVMVALKRLRGEDARAKDGYRYFNWFLPLTITLFIVLLVANLPELTFNLPLLKNLIIGTNEINTAAQQHALIMRIGISQIVAQIVALFIATPLSLAILFCADQRLQAGRALCASFQQVKPHFFKVLITIFLSYIWMLLIAFALSGIVHLMGHLGVLIGIIGMLVALVWLVPWMLLVHAQIYHQLVD